MGSQSWDTVSSHTRCSVFIVLVLVLPLPLVLCLIPRQFKTLDDWRDAPLTANYYLELDVQRFCHIIRLHSFWSHPSFTGSAYCLPLTGNRENLFVTSKWIRYCRALCSDYEWWQYIRYFHRRLKSWIDLGHGTYCLGPITVYHCQPIILFNMYSETDSQLSLPHDSHEIRNFKK